MTRRGFFHMIFLLVLFALFILYSFFFDNRNGRSPKKTAETKTLIRQASAPPAFLRVIETAPGQAASRRPSDRVRPNLRLIMNPGEQNEKK